VIDGTDSPRLPLKKSKLDRETSLRDDVLATLCARVIDELDITCMERFRASSVCALFEWLGCLCGIAGDSDRGGRSDVCSSPRLGCLISSVDIERRRVDAPFKAGDDSKKAIFSLLGEATGEMLPTVDASVSCVSRDLLDVEDASSSFTLAEEDPDETLPDALRCAWTVAISGALYVSMFVVLSSCTGPEIFLMSTDRLPWRVLAERGIDESEDMSS